MSASTVSTETMKPARPSYAELVSALDAAHALIEDLIWSAVPVPRDADTQFNQIGVLIARAKGEA